MEDVRLAFVRISTLHSITRGRKDLRHAFGCCPGGQVYVAITPAVPALCSYRVSFSCGDVVCIWDGGSNGGSSILLLGLNKGVCDFFAAVERGDEDE